MTLNSSANAIVIVIEPQQNSLQMSDVDGNIVEIRVFCYYETKLATLIAQPIFRLDAI